MLYSIKELEWELVSGLWVAKGIHGEYSVLDRPLRLVPLWYGNKPTVLGDELTTDEAKAAANAHHKEQLSKYLTPESGGSE